ncbi:MAG: aminotransferase class I/II-fold pyridoxal phosphate-dependent enzyme [Gemmatimonadales bacterium]|nr:MAG: aminotransferase class I/II-fold pyridoxal phosphate-dependent enzyme [Gemmatimonadales bacterium]
MTPPPRHPHSTAIHGEGPLGPRRPGAPVVPPLVRSATFHGGGPDDPGQLLYARYGNTPNALEVSRKLALLEGAEDSLVLGSGMAAISLTLLALVRAGDHLISSSEIYGATRLFMERELPRRGVEVTFVDASDARGWRRELRPRTRGLYLETPTNPGIRIRDPRPVAAVARERGIPLVVDATFATPLLLQPLKWGADLVVHSATKYLGGHSDLCAGVISGGSAMVEEVRGMLRLYGPSLDPQAAWLLDRGIRTLGVRMAGHSANATELAAWLDGQSGVERVIHLSREDHPDREVYQELMSGPGGMLGLVLSGGAPAAAAFCRALRLAAVAPSLGGVETLVSLPGLTSHRSLTLDARRAIGIPDGFVRISVGLEGVADLKEDLARGLHAAGRLAAP